MYYDHIKIYPDHINGSRRLYVLEHKKILVCWLSRKSVWSAVATDMWISMCLILQKCSAMLFQCVTHNVNSKPQCTIASSMAVTIQNGLRFIIGI